MTESTNAWSIRVLISKEHEGFYAHCADLPGLSVWGKTIQELERDLFEGVKLLYKLDHGIEVTIIPAANPQTAKPYVRRVTPINEYILAQAA